MMRILIVDDHKLVREALCSVLEKQPDISVVGLTGDGESAIASCPKLQPDLILMDVALPDINGIAATRRIVAANPSIKVLALSSSIERSVVESMLEAGATGYINKGASGDELLHGVRTVMAGKPYLSENVAEMLAQSEQNRRDRNVGNRLGKRETEVLRLVVEGLSSPQIATNLGIAIGTAEVHRRNLMHKLNLHSIADLTKYAIREGLVNP